MEDLDKESLYNLVSHYRKLCEVRKRGAKRKRSENGKGTKTTIFLF